MQALGRIEIASKDKARVLAKEWDIYRKHRWITGEGNVMLQMPEICTHRDSLRRDPRTAPPGLLNTREKVVEP